MYMGLIIMCPHAFVHKRRRRKNERAMLNLPDELDESLLQRGLGLAEVFNLGGHFGLLGLSVRLNLLQLLL